MVTWFIHQDHICTSNERGSQCQRYEKVNSQHQSAYSTGFFKSESESSWLSMFRHTRNTTIFEKIDWSLIINLHLLPELSPNMRAGFSKQTLLSCYIPYCIWDTQDANAKYGYKKLALDECQRSVVCVWWDELMYSHRSQSVGAAEGAVGDGGRGCVEEAVRERPPPRPAAEETQTALSVTL